MTTTTKILPAPRVSAAPPAPAPASASYRSGAAEHRSLRAELVSISPSRSTAGRSGAWWCLGRTRYFPKYATSATAYARTTRARKRGTTRTARRYRRPTATFCGVLIFAYAS
jgi:hypothetical protein